ncbi:MAG: 30S ribosomal protein S6 [Lachnospiraceae bacterium]|nr:30S ribosomal protein S6 [Lachnospiraceae bacterium]
MNKYELAVVINGKLDEDDKSAVLKKVQELIERFGGTIKNVDEWGKKRFAYEVHKKKDGYYNFIKFEAEAAAPGEIEKRIRIMENVERYLIVIDEHPDLIRKETEAKAAAKSEEQELAEPVEDEPKPEEENTAEVEDSPEEEPADDSAKAE